MRSRMVGGIELPVIGSIGENINNVVELRVRQLFLSVIGIPAMTVLVFLRIGFGQRALGLGHLFAGVLILGSFAELVEPGDIETARATRERILMHTPAPTPSAAASAPSAARPHRRTYDVNDPGYDVDIAGNAINQAERAAAIAPRPEAQGAAETAGEEPLGRSQVHADENPLLPRLNITPKTPTLTFAEFERLKATPFDDTRYMQHFEALFLFVCGAQLAFIYWGSLFRFRLWPLDKFIPALARLGNRLRENPLHSRMPGEPLLHFLTFRKSYWFTVLVLEPVLLVLLGFYLQNHLYRTLTGLFFFVAAGYLALLALVAYRAQQAQILNLQDARIEALAFAAQAAELEQGKQPTARASGRFFPAVSVPDTAIGARLLRRMAERNRDLLDDPAPVPAEPDAAAPASAPELPGEGSPAPTASRPEFAPQEAASGQRERQGASDSQGHPAPTTAEEGAQALRDIAEQQREASPEVPPDNAPAIKRG